MKKYVILLIMLLSLVINIATMVLVPVFGDGAIYVSMVRDLGSIIVPPPNEQYLPGFFVASGIIDKIINNPKLSVELVCIVSTLMYQIIMYVLIRKNYNERVSIISLILLAMSPMVIWNNSHRLIDSFSYLLGVATLYIFWNAIRSNSVYLQIILGILCLLDILTKQTNMISLGALGIYFAIYLFRNNEKINTLKRVSLVPIILLIGMYLSRDYLLPAYKYYIPENLNKYLEVKIVNDNPLEKFEVPRKYENIENIIMTKNGSLPYLYDHISEKNLFGIFQYYNIYLANNESSENELSPYGSITWSIFALIFIIGITTMVMGKRNEYSWVILSYIIAYIPFGNVFSILRYFYLAGIVCVVISAKGIEEIISKMPRLKFVFTSFISVYILLIVCSQLIYLNKFNNSYGHNLLSKNGAGIRELELVGREYPEIIGTMIFTPSSEPIYYLKSKVIWNWRLFLSESEEEIQQYMKKNDIRYLVIPKYSIGQYVWDGNKVTTNITSNFSNQYVVPIDSQFYRLITNESEYVRDQKYMAFDIFTRISH